MDSRDSRPAFTALTTGLRRNRHDRLALRPADFVAPRYADLSDHRLASALSREDASEEDGLDPLERTTCRLHRRWLHDCVASPQHVIPVTGTRWCRRCDRALHVAVDQLAGDVVLTCPRCGTPPVTRASRQLVRACRASLAASQDR